MRGCSWFQLGAAGEERTLLRAAGCSVRMALPGCPYGTPGGGSIPTVEGGSQEPSHELLIPCRRDPPSTSLGAIPGRPSAQPPRADLWCERCWQNHRRQESRQTDLAEHTGTAAILTVGSSAPDGIIGEADRALWHQGAGFLRRGQLCGLGRCRCGHGPGTAQ